MCLKNKIILFFPSFIGVMGLFYLFHYSKPESAPFFVNPLSIILLYISIPTFVFVASFFYRQSKLVCLGLTTKEYESIILFEKQMMDKDIDKSSENSDNFKKGNFYMEKVKKLSCVNKFKNFVGFFCKKIPDSLVLNQNF
jgi:hypothetical protein